MLEPEQFLLFGGILLLGAVLVVGGGLIALRSRRREGGADPLKPEHVEPAAPAPENGLSQPKREAPAWLNDWQRKLPPDTILLSRDPVSGEWSVEMEGQRYRRLRDIHDNKAASKIVSAIEGLKVFAGITLATPPAESPPPPAPAASGTPAPAAPAPAGAPRRFRQATHPAPPGSIIAQIETILQRELALHPDLSQRAIHMGAAEDGSLLIEIDQQFYKSPDEIPEPQVRELVMLAVHTWEKSS